MNCRDWEERLALYAGGDLGAPERAAVERHLGECAGCQVFLSGVTEGLRILKEAHTEQPAEAHFAAVRARVLAQVRREQRPWWRKGWVYGLAGVAAAVLVVIALRPRPVPAPPPAPRVAVSERPPAPLPVKERVAVPGRRGALRAGLPYRRRVRPAEPVIEPAKPLVVKLVTDDPNVVIYWITDTRGDLK